MAVSVIALQNRLQDNKDEVEELLIQLGFTNIKFNKSNSTTKSDYFTFPRIDGDNPMAMCLYLDKLNYQCFTRAKSGNLFTLVQDTLNLTFPQSLKWIANKLGMTEHEMNVKIRKPFGGFYSNIIRNQDEPELSIKTYEDSVLSEYCTKVNSMFLKDNISYVTQEKFGLGYSLEDNSILIPTYTFNGELCGCKARTNDKNCDLDKRWWAFLPYPKTLTVFGYHQNYHKIQEKGICVVEESEKGVMQLDSMDCHIGLGIGGHSISNVQARYIKSLLTRKIILAFDEGLEEEEIREEAKKLKIDNHILTNQVGYIYDKNNIYLPKGSKASPSDFGEDVFKKLMKNCVKYV